MYNFLDDSIYECNNDNFDYDIYTEKLFNFPFDGLADKICEIRDALPSEFISTSQGKKFIDKYGDDIIKICMILEKEPYELGSQELKAIGAIICSILSSIVLIRAILLDLTVLGIAAGIFTLIFAVIGLIIQSATNGRKYVDANIWSIINNIEMYLKKINPKTLPKPTQQKYYDILEAIDKNKSIFNEKKCDNMYDLTDLIFENYTEGKLSEDKMILLLEADKNDKEELAKKKKAVAKKIAATLLLIAGISAVIVLCRKSGDTDGEKKLSDIQKNLNKDVKEAKSDLQNAKTVSEVNAVEAKVNTAEKKATSVKRYKVKDTKSYGFTSKLAQFKYKKICKFIDDDKKNIADAEESIKLLEQDKDMPRDKRLEKIGLLLSQIDDDKAEIAEFRDVIKQDPEMKSLAEHQVKKQKWNGKKLHLGEDKKIYIKSSVDDIISDSYKYLYMIESVVERYDRDIITYESTMDIIDTICDTY